MSKSPYRNLLYFDWKRRNFLYSTKKISQMRNRGVIYANFAVDLFQINHLNITMNSTGLRPGFITTLLLFSLLSNFTRAALDEEMNVQDGYSDSIAVRNNTAIKLETIAPESSYQSVHGIELCETLQKRISSSQKLRIYYGKHRKVFKKDKMRLVEIIEDLANDKVINCKLKTLLQDKKFKFQLSSMEEINVQGRFDQSNKVIMIARECLYSNIRLISSILRHEIHHAHVFYGNLNNKREIIFESKTKPEPSTIPCTFFPDIPKAVDCKQIDKILDLGIKKSEKLLRMLDGVDTPSEEMDTYLKLIKNYKPLIIEAKVQKSEVQSLKNKGIINEQLEFINPGSLIDRRAGFVAPIIGIRSLGDKYFYQLRTCDDDNDPRAALRDLIFLRTAALEKHQDPIIRILELDATYHQVLEGYSELFEFIFEGLVDYHLQRSDNTYRQCMGSHN